MTVVACFLAAAFIGALAGQGPRALARELARVDGMNGTEFEYYAAGLLRDNGFANVNVTKGSGDYGADILCEKDGRQYAIQCKCHSAGVGLPAVQEIYAARQYYTCQVAAVLTNAGFSPGARELAQKTEVELWDRERLKELIDGSLKLSRRRDRQRDK